MDTASLQITYDGPALTHGEMEVRDLAPALLAMADLFQASAAVLNGRAIASTLRVRPTSRRGSYIGDLVLGVAAATAATAPLFHPLLADAKVFIDLLFGGKHEGLLGLIKHLRGQAPANVVDAGAGTLIIHNSGGATLMIAREVNILAGDRPVLEAAAGVVAPLKRDGIDFFAADGGRNHPVEVRKEDLAAFLGAPELARPVSVELDATTSTMWLQIATTDFHDESQRAWRFKPAGGSEFTAAIEDEHFLRQLFSDHVPIYPGTLLKAEVFTRTRLEGARPRASHTIRRVLEVRQPVNPEQLQLQPAETGFRRPMPKIARTPSAPRSAPIVVGHAGAPQADMQLLTPKAPKRRKVKKPRT